MASYKFTTDYRAVAWSTSSRQNVPIQAKEGDTRELDDDVAAWIERDRPGTIKEIKQTKTAQKNRGGKSAAKRAGADT